jgi:hypothetical protein
MMGNRCGERLLVTGWKVLLLIQGKNITDGAWVRGETISYWLESAITDSGKD